ncbi:hypothetical protein WJX81_002921 [Elliptochloris bilobata]|uniref:J domain-containing protein n=1 Tax=Elliptochloris bilobata TaxID=381761 RepID=A0AAW1RE90_9CHLO
MQEQLARGRAAARLVRELLFVQPQLKKDLRELLRRMDNGEAVHIAGIPDATLRGKLDKLFGYLHLRKTLQGIYTQRKGASPALALLGPVIDEVAGGTMEQDGEVEERAQPARVVGPAVPSAKLLRAAAEATEAILAEEAAEEAEEMIGPPPPELAAELDDAGADERSAEVVRILRLLEARERERAADAYDVLGLAPDAAAGKVKKRYWRLSLLVHPDKCSHARANDAFQAVSAAAKELQDAGKRRALDEAREDARLRAAAAEAVAAEERARQWRVARGTATAEDLTGPVRAQPAGREAWMTVLPEARRPSKPSQTSVTTFSQAGSRVGGVRDAGWAETPQDKLLRLSVAATAALTGPAGDAAGPGGGAAAAAAAGAVDAYNRGHRTKTLLEKHQERLQAQKKGAKKKRKADAAPAAAPAAVSAPDTACAGAHPWRPFSRERDLGVGPRLVSKEELLKKSGKLGDRFGGGADGGRAFL